MSMVISNRYYDQNHWNVCKTSNPANCYQCQMLKIVYGLQSGDYSFPDDSIKDSEPDSKKLKSTGDLKQQEEKAFQKGIVIKSFKNMVGQGNNEFLTARQQVNCFTLLF